MSTIKDVAKRAGVAISTVSKYINGGSVREYNAKAIKEAIEALDFKLNDVARTLKTNRAMTVGVMIPSLAGLFFTTIAAFMEDEFSKHGYNVILCDYRNDTDLEKMKLEFLLSKRVDGLVVVPRGSSKQLQTIMKQGIPVISIDRKLGDIEIDAVLSDSNKGSEIATDSLLQLGHEDIAIILGPEDVDTTTQRLDGYKSSMEKHSTLLKDEYIKYSDYTVAGGFKAMCDLLELSIRPTAVFSTNYEMTLGAIMAANEKGVDVPNDISIIGFDDMDMTQLVNPPLSVVAQDLESIAKQTALLLLKRMNGEYEDFPNIMMCDTSLIERESTRRLNEKSGYSK